MPFKSLKTKLDIAFLIVLIIPFAAATIFSIDYLSQRIKEHALARVSSDLDLVVLLLNNQITEIRYITQSYGQTNHWGLFLNLGLASRLRERLCTEAALKSLDQIEIIDSSGEIAASNNCSGEGEAFSMPKRLVEEALAGAVSAGLELISPTKGPDGGPPILSLTSASPLYHPDQARIVGVVLVRRFLRSEFLRQAWPIGLVPNTLVFAGKALIASNFEEAGESRSEPMNPAVAQTLYQWGEPAEEINLKPGGYLAKYRPLADTEGALVGALMVRMSAESYVQARLRASLTMAGIALVGLSLAFFIKYLIQRNILGPIRELTRGTRRLASGEYSYRLAVSAQDEIGSLAQSFDQMAANLERRTAELQATHRRLLDIIEFLPDATFVINQDGKVIAWNRAIEELTAIPKEKMLGKGAYAYAVPFYGAARPILIDLVGGATADPDPPYDFFERRGIILFAEHFVPAVYGGKGAYLWLTASPLFDKDGNLIGAIESIRDITDRREAERTLQQSENRLRQLSSQLLMAQEEERKRVAREVHDSIASSLAAINISLGNCVNHLEQGLPVLEPLKSSIAITLNAMEESRRIMSDLRPPVLDDLGILATIDWLCRHYQSISPDICIEKEIIIEEDEIPELLKIAIFRVLQEALNNVVKHSEAELVNLSLVRRDGCIELTIEDNGVGFGLKTARLDGDEKRGLGISSMRERTELSGGTFAIDSNPEQGTVVRCLWRQG